jgi:hypothetical protein
MAYGSTFDTRCVQTVRIPVSNSPRLIRSICEAHVVCVHSLSRSIMRNLISQCLSRSAMLPVHRSLVGRSFRIAASKKDLSPHPLGSPATTALSFGPMLHDPSRMSVLKTRWSPRFLSHVYRTQQHSSIETVSRPVCLEDNQIAALDTVHRLYPLPRPILDDPSVSLTVFNDGLDLGTRHVRSWFGTRFGKALLTP